LLLPCFPFRSLSKTFCHVWELVAVGDDVVGNDVVGDDVVGDDVVGDDTVGDGAVGDDTVGDGAGSVISEVFIVVDVNEDGSGGNSDRSSDKPFVLLLLLLLLLSADIGAVVVYSLHFPSSVK
jgi:hypothetical protein